MRDVLEHRGPDDVGLWRSRDGRTALGHRRLAVIAPGTEGHQPFVSHDGRFVITLNGEIYNYRALRTVLEEEGVAFSTNSDTEVLLEAFRRWGRDVSQHLSGMFAFAIWDDAERRMFCARDRTGEKPFYYASCGGSFLFGSELKALVEWPGFSKRIHYPAVIDFLTFGFVTDPMTIWEGCHKLPPGCSMEVRLGEHGPVASEPSPYWDMVFEPDEGVDDWGPEILSTLQEAVRETAVADVPLGTFLSGGVDSSAVTAALRRCGHDVASFTIGFEENSHDERPYARDVATACGTLHREQVVSARDVDDVQRNLVWHYDEPLNDYSYLPTYYLSRAAREHITVALSGDGGDELFGGYRRYQRLGSIEQLGRFLRGPLRPCLHRLAPVVTTQWSRTRRMLQQYSATETEMFADMLNLGFPVSRLRRTAVGPLAEALGDYRPDDTVRRHLRGAPPEDVGILNSMRYLDIKLTLAGGILTKVDRASMAVSLEVRSALLHRNVLGLAGRIPVRHLVDRNHSKEALKAALCSWLPRENLYRPKMGFALPLREWIDARAREHLRQPASASRLGEFFRESEIANLLQTHLSGKTDLTAILHGLFFLDRWLTRWC